MGKIRVKKYGDEILEIINEYADENNIREVLSGNICRCTGYVGIVEAVKEVIEINKNTQKHV